MLSRIPLITRTVKIFDILYVKGIHSEGQSLVNSTLADRKLLLSKVFTEKPGRMEMLTVRKGRDEKDIMRELNRVMDTK